MTVGSVSTRLHVVTVGDSSYKLRRADGECHWGPGHFWVASVAN